MLTSRLVDADGALGTRLVQGQAVALSSHPGPGSLRKQAKRRSPESPKPGGSYFQVSPEAATRMIAAYASPPPSAASAVVPEVADYPFTQLPDLRMRVMMVASRREPSSIFQLDRS